MIQFKSLPLVVRAYVCTVVATGALVLGFSTHKLLTSPPGTEWLILVLLTVLTGSFSVKVTSVNAYISVSEAFVFSSVLLFGPEAGTLTVLLECLVILFWMTPQGRPTYRALFNLAAPAVSIWVAGTILYTAFDFQPYSQAFTTLPKLTLPLLTFTTVYFVLNSSLVAIAVGLETRVRSFGIWWESFAWLSVNYFSGASLAAIIVTYTQKLELTTLAAIGPLLVVSYLTFRTAMGRAEDSYNHLSELNKLYLSTIETLAMAIDAKDQITHGHIRRVQTYAVGLAKQLDLGDDSLLKAIEAAALLHDMGKLAVPEHILNKPGKLTPAEFEKMKQHAGIGADILSAINFPYPVVPIVRHHHENWDGTGYPTGIRGTDIPIGARILSVVDCFDALTSDRPYRPKLSDEEALEILRERRGTMYDPIVVDTFVRVHREIAPEQSATQALHKGALTEITSTSSSARNQQTEAEAPTQTVERLTSATVHAILESGASSVEILRDVVCVQTGGDVAVLFKYDAAKDLLRFEAASGETPYFGETEVPLGERLSGWVAANRRTICNSDPALDLGEHARKHSPPLRFTLSVPVVDGRELLGVVSVYGTNEFTPEQKERLEQIAKVLTEQKHSSGRPLAARTLKQSGAQPVAPVSSLICVEIVPSGTEAHADVPPAILADIASELKLQLGPNDLLLQSRDGEFVALLARGDAKDVRALARSFRVTLRRVAMRSELGGRVEFCVDAVLAPVDASLLLDLIPTIEERRVTVAPPSGVLH